MTYHSLRLRHAFPLEGDTVVYVGPQNGYKAEDSEDPRFVAITTPKGYRFLVPVTGIQYAVPAENQSKALPAAQKLTR